MSLLHQVKLWLMLGSIFVVSVNVLIVQHLPLHILYPSTPNLVSHCNGPGNELKYNRPIAPFERESLIQKLPYVTGEVYCVKECDTLRKHLRSKAPRPGLSMISKLHEYLPQIKSKFFQLLPSLNTIIEDLKMVLTRKHVAKSPWDLAAEWISPHSLIGLNSSGLGDILTAMKSYGILFADIGYKGTQLKMSLVLERNQKVIFKPKRYGRYDIIDGNIYDGADRHNGEIAAFHLSQLLSLSMVPLTVGRKVSLQKNILPIASLTLSSTFFIRGKSTCFYGKCYYCRKESAVCDDGKILEGAMILWLSEKHRLSYFRHPWSRTYKNDQLARWENDHSFCHTFTPSFFTKKNFPLLLKIVDVAIFDFLIQNGDRHHLTVFSQYPDSSIILLDNGKSFGNPYVDHLDILAPLLQCCRIRKRTYDRLLLLTGGGLSHAMKYLLSTDPLDPVLTDLHLKALDRRLTFILAAIDMCKDQTEHGKVLL